jgi:serine/threonine protein phosphatase 1
VLTYAVGDIHGCSALLDSLMRRIETDAAGRAHKLVLLGDYIDRGPDSASVLARLMTLEESRPDSVVCLMGNHEDLMLRALDQPEMLAHWLHNGGAATLASFGCSEPRKVPRELVEWVAGRPTWFQDESRIYVHAGLRPGRSVASQTDYDRLWIREPFLGQDYDFGALVVHGHTPQWSGRPESRPHRVNLDTGAVFGGCLTAAIFTDEQAAPIGFLQAAA